MSESGEGELVEKMLPRVLAVLFSVIIGLSVWIFNDFYKRVRENIEAVESIKAEQLARREMLQHAVQDIAALSDSIGKLRETMVSSIRYLSEEHRVVREKEIVMSAEVKKLTRDVMVIVQQITRIEREYRLAFGHDEEGYRGYNPGVGQR